MIKSYPKNKPIRLKGEELKNFKEDVIERDMFCQYSGVSYGLQVHHIKLLSQGGSDTFDNTITVNCEVHERIHKGELEVVKINGEWVIREKTESKII